MEIIGTIITYIMMACCGAGAIATLVKPESELAGSFNEGLSILGICFVPCVGIMVSIPVISAFVQTAFSSLSGGALDIACIAAMFLPADSGGYAMVHELASSPETMIIGMLVSIMIGCTLAFNIGFGVSVNNKEDQRYVAMGTMCGMIGIPFGIFTTCVFMMLAKPYIRLDLATSGASTYQLQMTLDTILINLMPSILICILLVILLKFVPEIMIKVFIVFGKILMALLTLIAASSIIEYYTGIFSSTIGWPFDGIIADETNTFRAIELVGSIGMVLSGAYPMVYLLRHFFGKSLEKIGGLAGLDEAGSTGLILGMVNIPAAFTMVNKLRPHDKVIVVGFTVCAGYSIADWMAFSMNFQPNLLVFVFIGEIVAGICSIFAAKLLVLKKLEDKAA